MYYIFCERQYVPWLTDRTETLLANAAIEQENWKMVGYLQTLFV